MRLIGLTGGIGSGKSSVSRCLASQGALIIDADAITHQLQERGHAVWRQIWDAFGWAVLSPEGRLDRKRLGHIVFNDEAQRKRLNQIVHPQVQAEIRHAVENARQSGVAAAVLDVPLLIEGGLYRIVDEVWVVYATAEQQAYRIRQRDGVSEETAWQRIRAQMPLKDKLKYADYVIDNGGTIEDLEEVVRNLWQRVAAGE